jgi:cardiolipin synthase
MSEDQIHFYFEGDDYYCDLWRELEEARESIRIEVYKIDPDPIGFKLKDILVNQVQRGVRVQVICDALGSRSLPKTYIDELKEAGISVKIYHPFRWLKFFHLSINRRNHRKMVIIDSKVGFIGGMNFSAVHSQELSGLTRWRDTQARFTGKMVDKMVYFFKRSVREIKHRSFRMERFASENDVVSTQIYLGRNHIRRFFHRYIRRSHHLIAISTAYFVPDVLTTYLLVRAVKRGVRVMVLTNIDVSDVPAVRRVNRPILQYLAHHGVEVYSFLTRVMHAKTTFFDDRFAMLGSANINYRSFFRDLEICAFLRKEWAVSLLKEQFEKDLRESRLVSFAELKDISWWDRLLDKFFYLMRSFF